MSNSYLLHNICKEPMCRQLCVFTYSQLTCTECGLEQDIPVFQDEWNVSDRTAEYENVIDDDKNINRSCFALFDKIQISTHLPDDIINTAKNIYKTYLNLSKKTIKGEERRFEFLTACSFYASKNMHQGGSLTQSHITRLVFNDNGNTSIYWACKELEKELASSDYKYLFTVSLFNDNISKITESLPKVIKRVLDLTMTEGQNSEHYEKTKIQMMKTCHKIFDIMKKNEIDLICMTHVEKFAASIVFVSSKLLKLNAKLNCISLLLNVSEPMLLKMEKVILKNLKK